MDTSTSASSLEPETQLATFVSLGLQPELQVPETTSIEPNQSYNILI